MNNLLETLEEIREWIVNSAAREEEMRRVLHEIAAATNEQHIADMAEGALAYTGE